MGETVRDYFKELESEKIEISRSKSQADNCRELEEKWKEFRKKKSKQAIKTALLIEEAMDIFRDAHAYRVYLKQLEASTPEPEPEPDPRPSEEPSGGAAQPKSWKELLFGAAVEIGRAAVQAYVENKEAERQRSGGSFDRGLEHQRTMSLTGIWLAGDGLPVRFVQRGNQLAFTGVNQFGITVVQGTGTVDGDQAQLYFQYHDGMVYDQASATMQLSDDGRRMEGMVLYKLTGVRRMMGLIKQA